MYDQLNDASMSHSRQLGGYITLLQVTNMFFIRSASTMFNFKFCYTFIINVYNFDVTSVADSTADQEYDEDSPRACRWIATKKTVKSICTPAYMEHLDRLRILDVCWIPYGEYRSVRDFHVRSCYSGLLRWGRIVVYYQPERVMR